MKETGNDSNLTESELHVVASDELKEETTADLLIPDPEGDIQLNSMFGEAMYYSPPNSTFQVEGPITESTTLDPARRWNPPKVEGPQNDVT